MPARAVPSLLDRLQTGLVAPVERRETHGAWVLLDRERGLKIRKPVRFAFLDYSTLERRFAAAVEEVRVNQALAPGVYLGVRALLEHDGRLVVGGLGWHEDAVEYAVEMRRFDDRRTLDVLCANGRLDAEGIDRVARALAAFHAGAERCDGGAEAFRARVRADVREVEALAAGLPQVRTDGLSRFAEAAVARRAAQIDARAARGLWRDGHGDLRAEHVVFDERRLLIVDRIEFDAGLRRADVASDLAFLTMDLESLGHAWAADRLVEAYVRAGGDAGDARLRALFAWQRALVRVKVALLRDDEPSAVRLLDLADRLAWRERMPAVLLVVGPPASGKSTLAAELARRSGLPVLGSDRIRKELQGVRPTDRLGADAYCDEVTRTVYRTLADRTAQAIADRGGAIVDATGRSRALRELLVSRIRDHRPVVAVVCAAPGAVRRARARARLTDPRRVSDADAAVAEALGAEFEPVDDEPGIGRVLHAHTDQPLAGVVDDLAEGLDTSPRTV